LLTAGPAIVTLFFSRPAGRWLEHRPLIRSTFRSAALHRLGYLAIILLPLWLSPYLEIHGIVFITLFMSIPGTLLAIGFNSLFADAVPPEWRSEVVGRRNALMAVSLTATALLSGQLLDRIVFPTNYQIVFGLGALGAALSTYHLSRLKGEGQPPPRRVFRPLGDFARPGLQRFGDAIRLAAGMRYLSRFRGRPMLRLDLLGGSFGTFMLSYLFFYTFQFLPASLFPLAYVRSLQLSDSAISLGSALFYSTMLVISLRLPFINVRHSYKQILVFGAAIFSLYPLFIGIARDATLFLIASLVGGISWGLTSAALTNRLMERVPEDDRPAYMALNNLVMNVGILAGSLSGSLLGETMGVQNALVLIAGLRMLAGAFLWVWG
jgi:predicted MFS family arabinose efflux permease